jgi:negative regulator of sigma-B (phosphoserine phosphatase)
MMVRGARRSLNGHEKCGDAFAWWDDDELWTICLVDGLGHGSQAALAAEAALALAETNRSLPPARLIEAIDVGIHWSRGAAIAVVQVDAARRTLCYFGVGNVRAALFGDKALRFDGTPGIVGTTCRSPRAESVSWRDGDFLLVWTDGFDANLNLDPTSLRLKGDPGALAQRLLDQFSTRRDDAGVVCCLLEGAGS